MILIVGLGNPDSKYKNNRHNVGFMLINQLVEEYGATRINKASFKGELYKSKNILFLKPQTYMNLSGESVRAVSSYFEPEKIIVIHDDIDLPFGALRYKIGGGDGGHNGLRSINVHNSKNYCRVRIGIGRPDSKEDVSAFVLSDFSKQQKESLKEIFCTSLNAIKELVDTELNIVSSRYTLKGTSKVKK